MLTRKRVAELIDDPTLDVSEHEKALNSLSRLNSVSLGAQAIWAEIKKLQSTVQSRPIRILDVATGAGDLPISLSRLAEKENIQVEICATDISECALQYARTRVNSANITFQRLDVVKDEIPSNYDVIVNSLFLHHLDPVQIIALLARMRASASHLVLVNDLVRSHLSYALVWLATRILSTSYVVQFDGPVSVEAAFTAKELEEMALKAGMLDCAVSFNPPCRQLLIWRRR